MKVRASTNDDPALPTDEPIQRLRPADAPYHETLLSIYSNLTLLEDGGAASFSMAGIEPWVAENYLDSNATEYQDWQQQYGPV
jgi:hypothetical protein